MELALYLIPVTLGDTPHSQVLPDYNTGIIRNIKFFIVEDLRSARRFLKKVDRDINIDELTFLPWASMLLQRRLRPICVHWSKACRSA